MEIPDDVDQKQVFGYHAERCECLLTTAVVIESFVSTQAIGWIQSLLCLTIAGGVPLQPRDPKFTIF